MISQGTKSLLFGCHHWLMHPLCVLRAWVKLTGRWPTVRQLVCIFIHDWGHWGKQYLDDFEQKKDHWRLGAELARRLFGEEAYWFVRWHSRTSNGGTWRPNIFYYADKYSWLVAPHWWLRLNDAVEGFGQGNYREWIAQCRENWEQGCPKGAHQLYLERKETIEHERERSQNSSNHRGHKRPGNSNR